MPKPFERSSRENGVFYIVPRAGFLFFPELSYHVEHFTMGHAYSIPTSVYQAPVMPKLLPLVELLEVSNVFFSGCRCDCLDVDFILLKELPLLITDDWAVYRV